MGCPYYIVRTTRSQVCNLLVAHLFCFTAQQPLNLTALCCVKQYLIPHSTALVTHIISRYCTYAHITMAVRYRCNYSSHRRSNFNTAECRYGYLAAWAVASQSLVFLA